MDNLPVAIGGVGGSGTRLIASLLKTLGYYLGDDLNEPLDNLWFTLLFKRKQLWPIEHHHSELRTALQIFINAMTTRLPFTTREQALINQLGEEPKLHHPLAWRQARKTSLLDSVNLEKRVTQKWGWKEPNTHIFLPFLAGEVAGFKYIHVMRHALDMAVSNNQHQLLHWGPQMLDLRIEHKNVLHSVKYWCESHRRVLSCGQTMGSNFLLLNFDNFCALPESELPKLLEFLGIEISKSTIKMLTEEIRQPPGTGRGKRIDTSVIPKDQLQFISELGFSID